MMDPDIRQAMEERGARDRKNRVTAAEAAALAGAFQAPKDTRVETLTAAVYREVRRVATGGGRRAVFFSTDQGAPFDAPVAHTVARQLEREGYSASYEAPRHAFGDRAKVILTVTW